MIASVSSTAREYFGLLGMQSIQVVTHRRLALKAPSGCQRHQFDTAAGPILFQIFEQRADRVSRHAVGKELAQIAELQRFLRADQSSLEDDLRLLGIHAARPDPVVKRTGSTNRRKERKTRSPDSDRSY